MATISAIALSSNDGHQIGYFAEGNEVYAYNSAYIGETEVETA